MSKLAAFAAICICVLARSAWASELDQATSLFYQGNTHYSEEKYEQAIADYENVLRLGFESGALYYNIGNAYFKDGSLGKAILNYKRAQRLMAHDADLRSNLAYAVSLIKGGIVVVRRRWFSQLFFKLAESFSIDTVALTTVVIFWALSLLIIIFILARQTRTTLAYFCIGMLILLLCSISLFGIQFYNTQMRKQAVVIAEFSDAKFEPLTDATTFFTLYEGESVFVGATKKGWVKIKRFDGKQGWIEQKDIELL